MMTYPKRQVVVSPWTESSVAFARVLIGEGDVMRSAQATLVTAAMMATSRTILAGRTLLDIQRSSEWERPMYQCAS